jgi:hypothetical protein
MQPTLLISQSQSMSAGGDGFFHRYTSVRRALRPAFQQPPSRQLTAKTVSVNCGRKDHLLNGNFQVGNRWSKP